MLDMMKNHLAALSDGNWDEYRSHLADDAVYEEISTRQRVQGADAYVAAIQKWKKAFPDLKATVLGGFAAEDQVVAEVEWEGTQSGALETAFGTIPASNKRGRVRGVILTKHAGGKITETRHYFDLLTILTQIGVAPMAGAQPQAPQPSPVPPTQH